MATSSKVKLFHPAMKTAMKTSNDLSNDCFGHPTLSLSLSYNISIDNSQQLKRSPAMCARMSEHTTTTTAAIT
jgi:hypothetical protein